MEILEEKNKANELIKSVAIDSLIAKRNVILDKYFNALELIDEASKICKDESVYAPSITINHESLYRIKDSKNSIKIYIDREFWGRLFEASGVKDFMDSKAKKELIDSLYSKNGPPAFVKENIVSTFSEIYSNRNDMFERGVLNLFRGLSWSYKANQPSKFGKKIIINRALSDSLNNILYIKTDVLDKLDDLQRAFCILNNNSIPDRKNSMYQKLDRLCEYQWKGEYFDLKFYKIGSVHVTFNMPDLVKKMNKILCKHYPNALANEAR